MDTMPRLHRILDIHTLKRGLYSSSIFIMLFLVFGVFTIYNRVAFDTNYLKAANISVIVNQASFLMVVGVAQAIALLTGDVNLSIGSVMAVTTVLFGRMLQQSSDIPLFIPIMLILFLGACIGFLNGILITKLKIPAFIASFATMYICRGFAWVFLGKTVIYRLDEGFRTISMGKVYTIGEFTITVPMLIALALILVVNFMLTRSTFGRKIYFVGSNVVAAQASGIPTDRVRITNQVISSFLAAFAGLLYVARLNACEPGMAIKTHFEAITVALLGGFVMTGGYGNVWGVVGGAIIMTAIQNGMNSIQLPSELQTLVMGLIIILTVFMNTFLLEKKMLVADKNIETKKAIISRGAQI
ncbi:MAG: ABC transporter permease [Spirochaetae bacterium HGW-Spirochaetae-4]|nr:MAG: ABC transporter permease [Spirochaetae bacterium HGW-Spirochaetae-4]